MGRRRPKERVYDVNGLEVSCLPATRDAVTALFGDQHWIKVASGEALEQSAVDHFEWMRSAQRLQEQQ
jgi:hypothetical protein